MDAKVREAVERKCKYGAMSNYPDYGYTTHDEVALSPQCAFDDHVIADAYLAERDETPVDEAWLRSIGAESLSGDDVIIGWENDYGHPLSFDCVNQHLFIYGDRVLHDVDYPTRSDVLAILRALKIPINTQSK